MTWPWTSPEDITAWEMLCFFNFLSRVMADNVFAISWSVMFTSLCTCKEVAHNPSHAKIKCVWLRNGESKRESLCVCGGAGTAKGITLFCLGVWSALNTYLVWMQTLTLFLWNLSVDVYSLPWCSEGSAQCLSDGLISSRDMQEDLWHAPIDLSCLFTHTDTQTHKCVVLSCCHQVNHHVHLSLSRLKKNYKFIFKQMGTQVPALAYVL